MVNLQSRQRRPHDFQSNGPLEPQTTLEVNDPLATSCRSDATKAGRVKRCVAKGEVRIVQNVDERRLDFKADPFTNRESLCGAHVKIEESSSRNAVQWEVAKRAWCRLSQQAGLEC